MLVSDFNKGAVEPPYTYADYLKNMGIGIAGVNKCYCDDLVRVSTLPVPSLENTNCEKNEEDKSMYKYRREIQFEDVKFAKIFFMDLMKSIIANDNWRQEYYEGLIDISLNKGVVLNASTVEISVDEKSETLGIYDCVADAISRYEDSISWVKYGRTPAKDCVNKSTPKDRADEYLNGDYH